MDSPCQISIFSQAGYLVSLQQTQGPGDAERLAREEKAAIFGLAHEDDWPSAALIIPAAGEIRLSGLHTGLHLLLTFRDPPPDAALLAAAREAGMALSALSDYDLTGQNRCAPGTLVLGYGALEDALCPSVGEMLKKVCTAARDRSSAV